MARRRVSETEGDGAPTIPRSMLPLRPMSVPDLITRGHALDEWFEAHRVPPSLRPQMVRDAKTSYGIEELDPRLLLKQQIERENNP